MNKVLKLFIPFLSVLMIMMFIGCSGESDPAADDPAQYPQGADGSVQTKGGLFPVSAVAYDKQASIQFHVWDESVEGNFRRLSNGDYVEPVEQKIGITVSPWLDGERVFVSNGSSYSEEALINEDGMYVGDFDFGVNKDAYLAQPILIQVIYTDGFASKKKLVVSTRNDYRAGPGKLVTPGLVISMGKDVLGGFKSALGNTLGSEVTVFEPADNSTGDDQGIFHLEAPGMLVGDMMFMDTDADGVRGTNIGFEDATVTDIPLLKKLLGLLINGKAIMSTGPTVFDLGELLGGLGGDDGGEDAMSALMGGLDIDKHLFFNMYGLPDATTPDYAVLGGGLYMAEGDTLTLDRDPDGPGGYLFPEVEEDSSRDNIDMDRIKTGEHGMGIALSHYNLNQVLGGIAENLVIELPAATLPIPLAIPSLPPGNSQIMKITINPAGMNIDLAAYPGTDTPARMDILDMRMEYIQNGDAMWIMSFDMNLSADIGLSLDEEGGLSLDMALAPLDDTSFNNTHVMKDRMGISVFDNSTFVLSLFEGLSGLTGGAPGDPFVIGIPLSGAMGLIPVQDGELGSITYDEQGNCFMNLALSNIDATNLCFISTAGSF